MPNQNKPTPQYVLIQPDHQVAEDEIDLLALFGVLKKRFKIIVILVVLCTALSVVYALSLPEIYRSTAIINITVSAKRGGGGPLGNISTAASNWLFGGNNNSNTELLNFLNSRTLKIRLLEKYDLLSKLFGNKIDPQEAPSTQDGIKALGDIFEVLSDNNTGLIELSWDDEDPEFCSKMLSRVIVELKQYLDFEYINDARRTRIFIDGQLEKAEIELKKWERVVPGEKIIMSEILREREVAAQVYKELRIQLELAKITEAQEMVQFKVLDQPFIPEDRYKPSRSKIVMMACVASTFLAIFLAFFLEFIENTKKSRRKPEEDV